MPSSAPEDWAERIRDQIRDHERERRDKGAESPESTRVIGGEDGPAPKDEFPRMIRYEIRDRLGEGTTSVVYRAWDRELRRLVALKVLHPAACAVGLTRERFHRGAEAAAGLIHPNVAAVYDAGEENGRPYIVMELVEGKALGDVLALDSLDVRARIRLLEKTARGVAAAHEKGIVHRDLKPANILVTSSGEPKVGDFGLAHLEDSAAALTRTGTTLGTPLYMAPEQVEGRSKDVTLRTDVYALGAILYEAVTGRPPFQSDSIAQLYGKILREEPPAPRELNLGLSREVEIIIQKAMDKEPGRRFAHAGEFADDLGRHLADEPISARPSSLLYRLRRRLMKNPVATALASGILLALGTTLLFWFRYSRERELAIRTLRDTARLSVASALELRRKGGNPEMRRFLPALESAYRDAVERAPALAEVEYLMGRMHRALLEDDQALEYQERALRKDPGFAPALYERALLLSKEYGRRRRGALDSSRLLDKAAPTSEDLERSTPELARLRARILADGEALHRILQGNAGAASFTGVSEAHVLAARGILAHHQARYLEALASLEAAVRKDPLLEEAWESLARSLQAKEARMHDEKERRWAEAEARYTEAASIDRGYVPHLVGRSEVRIERGLSRMDRRASPLADYAAAEADLGQALVLSPDTADLWRRRGTLRTLRGIRRMAWAEDPLPDYRQAEEDFAESERRDRASPELWLWRGYLKTHLGVHVMKSGKDPLEDYRRAERDLTEAIRLAPEFVEARRYRSYALMKQAYHRETTGGDPFNDYAKAEQDLKEALRLNPRSASIWKALGDLRKRRASFRITRNQDPLPDLTEAEKGFTRAQELVGEDADIFAQRGEVRLQKALAREKAGDGSGSRKDAASAGGDFREAIRIDPGLGPALEESLKEAGKRASLRSGD